MAWIGEDRWCGSVRPHRVIDGVSVAMRIDGMVRKIVTIDGSPRAMMGVSLVKR